MEDNLFLIVVGNDVAAECDVTNAILSYRTTIKQFKLRNLTVKKVNNSAIITNKLTIAIAPTIGTKAWEKARWRIKFLSKNRVLALLYISKVGNFVVDNARFIGEIRCFFGQNLHVAAVLYHNENNDKDAIQKCHKLKDACDGNVVCIKSTLLKRDKSDLAKQAIRVISNCIILNSKSRFPWWIKYRRDILLKRATVTSTEKTTPSKYEETAPEGYTDVRKRLETFETWPSEIMLTPPLLAAAGFVYTGVDDECVCFSCNVSVRKWNALHDPWLEHIRWFPMCSYLKDIWGEKDVVETHRTIKTTDAFIKDKQSATKDAIDETAPTPRTDERQLERAKTPDNVEVVLHDEHRKLYLRTLQFGTVASRHTRVNVVGHQSVGKTTLVKRLQNMPIVCPDNLLPPTEGLEIEQVMSRVLDIGDGKRFWETQTQGYDQELNYERMAWAISEYSLAEDIPKEIHHHVSIAHESKERDHNETTTGTQTNPAAKGKESSITETKFQTREYDLSELSYMIGSEEIVEEGIISNACCASYNKSQEDGLRTYSVTAESEEYLKQVVRKMQFSPGERIYLTYWDFAGQTTYYTTHQAFMSPSVVYLLVIDLNKALNDVIHENLAFTRSAGTENTEDVSVLDTIRFWWDSIKTYGNDDNTPVIVVGTHSDMVDEKTIEKIFERIKNVMKVGSLQCIAINNTLSASDDDTLTELKNKIIDEGLGVTDHKIPASWFALEFRLLRIKSEDRNKITMSVEEELRHLDSTSDVPLNDIARLKNFLEYQHYKGYLMYFQEPGLDNLILLDPMALVKFINIIMRRKPKDSFPLSLRVKNYGWNSDGILDEKFILTAVENETNGFKENVETIIKILIHLKIIFQKYDHQETKVFFMPCLLPKRSQDVPLMASSKECQKTPRIKISFDRGIIPPPVFHSLIASLLSEWNPQTINDSVSIFYNYACFCIKGEIGLLEMVWKDSSIYLYVISFLKTDSLKDLRGDECINTIKRHLELISKTYKRHLPDCVVSVCCPEHNIPPSFVSLKSLLVDHSAMCFGDTRNPHAVTEESVLGTWYNSSKMTNTCQNTQLQQPLDDRMMGRFARKLVFDDTNTLANKLDIHNAYLVAENASNIYRNDKKLARFLVLLEWKKRRGEPNIGVLLDMLTRGRTYTQEELLKVTTPEGNHAENETVPSDKHLGKIATRIGKEYRHLALKLNLKDVEIEQIVHNHPHDVTEQTRAILMKWKQLRHPNSTFKELQAAMTGVKIATQDVFKDILLSENEKKKLREPPTDQQCCELSKRIGSQYTFLFLELGVKYDVIQTIRKQEKVEEDINFNLIIKWRNGNSSATVQSFVDAAAEVGVMNVSDVI